VAHHHRYRSDLADWWCDDCDTVTDFCTELGGPGKPAERVTAEEYAEKRAAYDEMAARAASYTEQLRNATKEDPSDG
jgi:hypothetical protein